MKAKEFLGFDFTPWTMSFSEDIFPGQDCLTLSNNINDYSVNFRDDDNGLVIEWISDDDEDQLEFVVNGSSQSSEEIINLVKIKLEELIQL